MKDLVRKLLVPSVLSMALLLPLSCSKKSNPFSPSNQRNVEVTAKYVGNGREACHITHNLYLHLLVPGTIEPYKSSSFSITPDDLRKGKKHTFLNVEPREYELYVFYDWDDNGMWANNLDPIGGQYPIYFEMPSNNSTSLNCDIMDPDHGSNGGWMSGRIFYDGSETGEHKVYVQLVDSSDHVVFTGQASSRAVDLSREPFINYSISEIPPGGPYWGLAFWDINDNEEYELYDPSAWGNDPRLDCYLFYISKNLPTNDVDFHIEDI